MKTHTKLNQMPQGTPVSEEEHESQIVRPVMRNWTAGDEAYAKERKRQMFWMSPLTILGIIPWLIYQLTVAILTGVYVCQDVYALLCKRKCKHLNQN